MELWPLLIPACIVCAAAASVIRRERGRLRPAADETGTDVARLTLAELRVPDGVVADLSAVRERTVAPPGSLGARLRSTAERTAPAAPSKRPTQIRRRRRQPLVATRRSA